MPLQIISTPARDASPFNVSYWGAGFNPQVFEYQRKDHEILGISAGPGPGQVEIDIFKPGDTTADMYANFIGSKIYMKLDSGVEAFYTVVGYDTTMIALNIFVEGAVPATDEGFINSDIFSPGHRALTKITVNDDPTQTVVAKHSGNAKGLIRVDLSGFLKTFTQAADIDTDYSQPVVLDVNKFFKYDISVGETWQTHSSPDYVPLAQDFYIAHAALQYNPHGSNMAAYVPFINEPNINRRAKFLSTDPLPVVFTGYPIDLSFIMTAELAVKQIFVGVTCLNVNKEVVAGGVTTSALLIEPVSILLIRTGGDGLAISAESSAYEIDVEPGINRLRIGDSYLPNVRFVEYCLYYLNDDDEVVIVTEQKLIAVDNPSCIKCGVYVKWLNLLAGWNYTLFEYRAEHSIAINDQTFIDRLILDWSNERPTQDALNKEAVPQIKIGKNDVPDEHMKTLATMLYSKKAYYLETRVPYAFAPCLVSSKGAVLFDTFDKLGDFETALLLAPLNLQNL